MLNYQSLAYHDAIYIRETLKKQPAPEFDTWLRRIGILDAAGRLGSVDAQALLAPARHLIDRLGEAA